MLKTVRLSQAKKTAGCAVTYRAGSTSCFGTCPQSCSLNPQPDQSTERVDKAYLRTLLAAVPHKGVSFTYTHFEPSQWASEFKARQAAGKPTTVVNYSCESAVDALSGLAQGVPVVMALPKGSERKVAHLGAHRVIRCPAEYQDITCKDCGNGSPLCARADRNYIIAFYGHGAAAKAVCRPIQGGCYAASGNVRLNWDATIGPAPDELDQLGEFARTLPRGTILRHHVAGDMGVDPC